MEFGAFLTTAQPPAFTEDDVFRGVKRYALCAEETSFDSVWLLEHHFTRFGLCPCTITLAGYLLGMTCTLRVGTAVTVITTDHPIRLAEKVAVLDRMSGGRFELGIGRGSFVKDFEAFGVDMSQSHRLLDEYYREMVSIFETGITTIPDGRGGTSEVEVFPSPSTKPVPPMVVVAQSPSTVRWAAENGLGMLLHYWMEDEAKKAQLELYADLAEAAGRDPDDAPHVLSCIAFLGETREAARGELVSTLSWWYEEGSRATHLLEKTAQDLPNYSWILAQAEQHALRAPSSVLEAVETMMDRNPIGTPEQVRERIDELRTITGIERFIFGFEGTGKIDRTVEVMRRFSDEVIDVLRAPTSGTGSNVA
jgi:alkanal monooxygenase alpha chain